mmetsp:Transcript_79281/g.242594  ORF Transcript_79281/g.242594 Transcript_79281/m.242594 type:complete len:203 (-) Transcript_79281:1101-1709(-)
MVRDELGGPQERLAEPHVQLAAHQELGDAGRRTGCGSGPTHPQEDALCDVVYLRDHPCGAARSRRGALGACDDGALVALRGHDEVPSVEEEREAVARVQDHGAPQLEPLLRRAQRHEPPLEERAERRGALPAPQLRLRPPIELLPEGVRKQRREILDTELAHIVVPTMDRQPVREVQQEVQHQRKRSHLRLAAPQPHVDVAL